MKAIDMKPGDLVMRFVGGMSARQMTVSSVTGDRIVCGEWEFDRKTGAELDDGIGLPPGVCASYIAPVAETELERYQREIEIINNLPDRERWLWTILERQGESPRDRAWPTEGGNEPIPEPGWDRTGTHHLATVHDLYKQLVEAGRIK